MSRDQDRFRVELDVGAGSERREKSAAPIRKPTADTPFCIGLIGDFSGRESRGIVERGRALAARRPLRVDRDNLDEVRARVAPELVLDVGNRSRVSVRFAALDDFHPDRLYERLPHLRTLHEASALPVSSPALPERERTSPAPAGSVLDQILGDAPLPPGGAALAAAPTERHSPARDTSLDEYVRRAVAPHLVPNADPARQRAQARVDTQIETEMRALMHHPSFQSLEALWRGVDFLVRRLETDEMLRVYIIDISKSELAADLAIRVDGQPSGMRHLLVDASVGTLGAMPWAVLAGCYTFGANDDDVGLLTRVATLARTAGAPWLAAAHPELVGTPSFGVAPDVDDWSRDVSPTWTELRQSSDARFLGLALPRFLLRLPYGRETDATEVMKFEELEQASDHEAYLWGNPALACTLLLGEAFTESGWALRPHLDITGLPLHVIRTGTDVEALPCAEAVLPERAMQRVLDRGLMPLLSMKGGDAVRLGRFQSIADPVASLAGRWTHAPDGDTG